MSFDRFSATVITGWLQSLTTLLLLIVVWMTFVGLLMRFVWTPSLSDTALPFIVGILQFAVIEASTPDRFGIWLVGLSVLSLVMAFLTQRYFKLARLNPQNAEFFEIVSPATWKDFLPSFVSSLYALIAGIAVLTFSITSWLLTLIIVPVIAGLVYYIYDQNRYWVMSIPSAGKPAADVTPRTEES